MSVMFKILILFLSKNEISLLLCCHVKSDDTHSVKVKAEHVSETSINSILSLQLQLPPWRRGIVSDQKVI